MCEGVEEDLDIKRIVASPKRIQSMNHKMDSSIPNTSPTKSRKIKSHFSFN